jgi:hypothetical protein
MVKPVSGVSRGNPLNGRLQGILGAGLRLAQHGFGFAIGLLDGGKIGEYGVRDKTAPRAWLIIPAGPLSDGPADYPAPRPHRDANAVPARTRYEGEAAPHHSKNIKACP